MSSSDQSHPQLAILKRGKRTVATQLKNDFGRPSGTQQLEEILNHLIDLDKPFDFEAADWCRYLIAGGVPFAEFLENGNNYIT